MSDMVAMMKLFFARCALLDIEVYILRVQCIHAAIGVYYIQHGCVLCAGSDVGRQKNACGF